MGSGDSWTHLPRDCDGLDGLLDMEQEAASTQEFLEREGDEQRTSDKQSKLAATRWDGVIAPALGNFSVQYNFQAIAIALAIAKRSSATPQRSWVNSQCKSAVFTGCILGQFCMGYVGDLIGRARALYLTLVMSAFGAVASATLPWGDAMTIYTVVIIARFVIGFGLGGVYPLSATHAAESSQTGDGIDTSQDKAEATARAADAFFWQTPGYVAPYLAAIVLRGSMQSADQSLQWRLLLGLGAVPATAVVVLCRPLHNDSIAAKLGSQTAKTNNALRASLVKPSTWRLIAGTGGCWLLYDVAFYGITLMGPVVVSSCFDRHESIMDEAWQQTIALSFAAPAVLATTHLIRRGYEPKRLQYLGFYLMAFAYVALAGLRHADYTGWSLYISYCFLNFCLSVGPNVTTFVLPSATYPLETRSTMNGVSSALGKLGAVLGTELLPVLFDSFGLNAVLLACAAISVLGAIVTHLCVDLVLKDIMETIPRPLTNERGASSPGGLASSSSSAADRDYKQAMTRPSTLREADLI